MTRFNKKIKFNYYISIANKKKKCIAVSAYNNFKNYSVNIKSGFPFVFFKSSNVSLKYVRNIIV